MPDMRRQDRKLTEGETREILETGEYGVLSMVMNNGAPYAVPLNFAFDSDRNVIYMHCSAEGGQKLECLRSHPAVSFTVVSKTELMPEKFATKYWSANVTGRIAIIENRTEKQKGIEAILWKYSPEHTEKGLKYIEGAIDRIVILELNVCQMTGKARKR